MGLFDVEGEDPLLRKIKKWNEDRKLRKDQEEAIRKDVYNKNYGSLYAQEYKKKLQQQIKQKVNPNRSGGIFGNSGSNVRSKSRSSGFLQPDTNAINRVLYGDMMNPFSPENRRYQSRSRNPEMHKHKHKKRIVIYT